MTYLAAIGRTTPEADKPMDSYIDISEILATVDLLEFYSKCQLVLRAVRIEKLFSASTRELMRRLAKYTDQKVSTQFLRLRNSLSRSITLLFGLCCSSPTYIFNAIFGVHATRIPSILPVLG